MNLLNYISITSLTLLLNVICISCIKQSREECSPTYRGIVTVKDKNYSNATEIPSYLLRDEQAPLSQFVQRLSYEFTQANTGKLIDSLSYLLIPETGQTYTINFPDLTPGKYISHIQGNASLPVTGTNNIPVYDLHPSSQEGEDIYLFQDTILFNSEKTEITLPLTRTKGALFIQIENLPDSVRKITETIEHIYQHITKDAVYSGETTVEKTFTDNLHPVASLLTLVAPTVANKQSALHLALYGPHGDTPFMFISDIPLTIRRNEITAFKFNFIPEGGIEIWVISNGSWNKSHDLNVTL